MMLHEETLLVFPFQFSRPKGYYNLNFLCKCNGSTRRAEHHVASS